MLLFFLNVAGAAALLIYAVRMVRTGVERAFAPQLRHWLRASARNRLVAAASGSTVALLMQSSTAVAVLAAGFVTAGTISAGVGLAMLLGADIGSALVVQALVLRPVWLAPLLLLIGVASFLRTQEKPGRQIGRILIGLALTFVALDMIAHASAPIRDLAGLPSVAGFLQQDPISTFVLGAALAWVIHSSVAAVLMVMVFATQGLLTIPVAAALVLGANLGGSFIAVMLTLGASAGARQMVWANALVRGGGAAACLAALSLVPHDWSWLGATPGRQVINLHLLFNLAVAAIGLAMIPALLAVLSRVIPHRPDPALTQDLPGALDPAALAEPERALACAARQVLHMGETAEAMLRLVLPLFARWDRTEAAAIAAAELRLDRMHAATKAYLARLDTPTEDPELSRRAADLVEQAAHFEAAGDAVARMSFGLARKLGAEGLAFAADDRQDLEDFHDSVLATAQSALQVQMTRNPAAARDLVAQKERARRQEQALQQTHMARLRQANPESAATSNIHQELLRELKQINTCFVMVAYPILTESGELLETRLRRA
ncbi:phosphate:Na+ symporter [Rhodobacter viridis]|uniref:Phosphate:Na+ symporter n=1 Tax=Rhodobacter viridis TaxID=1054202 RepID=A0A318TVD5_9RHOB|nr:Na/Pi cotransporter family protein [Rhodobacter viridis]PYF06928.1 phosphate:Na+ symporter [Rhodobacter viridis]